MEKEIVNQVQEAQRVPYRRNMPRHILIKLAKTKNKERLLKAAREKQRVTYKGSPICLMLIFQQQLCRPEGTGRIYLSTEREKSTIKITVPREDLIQN